MEIHMKKDETIEIWRDEGNISDKIIKVVIDRKGEIDILIKKNYDSCTITKEK